MLGLFITLGSNPGVEKIGDIPIYRMVGVGERQKEHVAGFEQCLPAPGCPAQPIPGEVGLPAIGQDPAILPPVDPVDVAFHQQVFGHAVPDRCSLQADFAIVGDELSLPEMEQAFVAEQNAGGSSGGGRMWCACLQAPGVRRNGS